MNLINYFNMKIGVPVEKKTRWRTSWRLAGTMLTRPGATRPPITTSSWKYIHR